MSKQSHDTNALPYIFGFVYSLGFTFIAYYLVVNKTFAGTMLLTMILGTAVLQMIVQIVFFLHLGRGPKPLYNVTFFVATVGMIMVVVGGSIWIMSHLNYNMAPTEASKYLAEQEGISQIEGAKTGACQGTRSNHKVTITGGKVSPVYIEANLCDSLTFISQDDIEREITFGTHPQHSAYAGVSELTVSKRRSATITLNQAGSYEFHDHLDPRVSGSFTITP